MIRSSILLSVLAVLASAPVLQAQDATQAPAASESQPADVTLDVGEVVSEDGTYLKEMSGDWEVECLKVEDRDDPCQIHQVLRQGDNAVAEVSLFRLEGGGQVVAGATFLVPLETLLPRKMTIQVDSGQAKRYEYSFCNRLGCYARVGFTAEEIEAFKKGSIAKVTIVPVLAPDQDVVLDMSLKGFTAGYEQVTAIKQ